MSTESGAQAPLPGVAQPVVGTGQPMTLRFDAQQSFQLEAIAAVVDVFRGQAQAAQSFALRDASFALAGVTELGVGNHLALSREQLAQNILAVQRRHGLAEGVAPGPLELSVEMETGTGKTYVYLRTLFELHVRYGFTKFVIVVPGVPVREGVMASLALMKEHLRALYDAVPLNDWVYDSARLTQVRSFVHSNQLQIMVVNYQSFATDKTLMRRESDRFSGATPIELIARCRPVVVLDEPQNFGSENAVDALRRLQPLAMLRYSATHKQAPNLVYRLDPVRAYELGLVKRIEVDAVLDEPDFNRPYLRVESVRVQKGKLQARVEMDVTGARGPVRKTVSLSKNGDDLYVFSKEREQYRGYVVDGIDAQAGYVRFANGVTLSVGQLHGARRDDVMRVQVRQTLRRHLDKELTVQGMKVGERLKVLSLFFLDKVSNFVGDEPKVRRWFDEEYEALRKDARYLPLGLPEAERVRAHYFAKKEGTSEYKDTSGNTKADDGAYALIMRDKVRLLSLDEPVRFIFSHSALKEGWDNPNVFQICTLNETHSETKKRQEIGRGLRLPVNESGERSRSPLVNRLTVVANEHYREFAAALQTELREEWGTTKTVPIDNGRERRKVKLKKGWQFDEAFKALWARISPKTRYSVHFDTRELVARVVEHMKLMPKVEPVQITVEGSDLRLHPDGIDTALRSMSVVKLDANLESVPDVIGFLQRHTKLTRSTLAEMVVQSGRVGDLLVNPQTFLDQTLAIIRQDLQELMVSGVRYERLGDEVWEMSLFDEKELESYTSRLVEVRKSLGEAIEFDSEVERAFAETLDAREDVLFFLKLPRWYHVKTPVGEYVPDWAIVLKEGEGEARLYLVRETKSSWERIKMRGTEWARIVSGLAHYRVLGVDYAVATDGKKLAVGASDGALPADLVPQAPVMAPPAPGASAAPREQVQAFATAKLDALLREVDAARGRPEGLDLRASETGPFAHLTALLACDALGAGFAALVGALWFAARKGEQVLRGAQLDAMGEMLELLRSRPTLPETEAWALIEALPKRGLDPEIHAFNKLATFARTEEEPDVKDR